MLKLATSQWPGLAKQGVKVIVSNFGDPWTQFNDLTAYSVRFPYLGKYPKVVFMSHRYPRPEMRIDQDADALARFEAIIKDINEQMKVSEKEAKNRQYEMEARHDT